MFETIGDRITYCRSLLQLTRNEMASEIGMGISLPTLARWELNTVIPSSKKIQILTEFFLHKGIEVSSEWLKEGSGYPPITLDLKKFDANQFDEIAYNTLIVVSNKIKNFFFQQVTSNFLRPYISFGDYIGGISEDNLKLLNNKLCFLFQVGDSATAGIFQHDQNVILNLSGETLPVLKDKVKIGEVQWIIRRP